MVTRVKCVPNQMFEVSLGNIVYAALMLLGVYLS